MDQEKNRLAQLQQKSLEFDDEDNDFCEDQNSTESLLSLVQPEMSTLSRHWLAALKDYALLSLPTGMI